MLELLYTLLFGGIFVALLVLIGQLGKGRQILLTMALTLPLLGFWTGGGLLAYAGLPDQLVTERDFADLGMVLLFGTLGLIFFGYIYLLFLWLIWQK